MGDKKFTLIELHLDGEASFGPGSIAGALFGRGEETTETETEWESSEDDAAAGTEEESGGRSAAGVVVALVLLVGLAFAVRKFRGGDEEFEELEESGAVDERDVVVN